MNIHDKLLYTVVIVNRMNIKLSNHVQQTCKYLGGSFKQIMVPHRTNGVHLLP